MSAINQTERLSKPPQSASYVTDPSNLEKLASKTSQVIQNFHEQGLFDAYCGPYTALKSLRLLGIPVHVSTVLNNFDVDKINREGTAGEEIRQALSFHANKEFIRSPSLTIDQLEALLSKKAPIAVLLTGTPNHWLTLVGFDQDCFYCLDYNEFVAFDKAEFLSGCLLFVYPNINNYWGDFFGRRSANSNETTISQPLRSHRGRAG